MARRQPEGEQWFPIAEILGEAFRHVSRRTEEGRTCALQIRASFAAQDDRVKEIMFAADGSSGLSCHKYENFLHTDFDALRNVHPTNRFQDWRSYVPASVRKVFGILPPDARAAIYAVAMERVKEAVAAFDRAQRILSDKTPDERDAILDKPEFSFHGHADDWRHWISAEVRETWYRMPHDARAALYMAAEETVARVKRMEGQGA